MPHGISITNPSFRARVRFFAEHGGYCEPPGRMTCALELARAELEADQLGLTVGFEPAPELWDGDAPAPEHLLNATLYRPRCERPSTDDDFEPVGALGMIGVDSLSDPYLRVVEAELAADYLAELYARQNAAIVRGVD